MCVAFQVVENAFGLQAVVDFLVYVKDALAGQRAESVDEHAKLIQRSDNCEVHLFAQSEVLFARAGGCVDDSGSFVLGHLFPWDDPMLNALLGFEFVERTGVSQTHQRVAGHLFQDFVLALEHGNEALGQVDFVVPLAHFHVHQFRMNRRCDVGCQSPGRRGPDQQGLVCSIQNREFHEQSGMDDLAVALGDDLVFGQTRTTPWTPGHHVRSFVEQTFFEANLKKVPDGVVVLV